MGSEPLPGKKGLCKTWILHYLGFIISQLPQALLKQAVLCLAQRPVQLRSLTKKSEVCDAPQSVYWHSSDPAAPHTEAGGS